MEKFETENYLVEIVGTHHRVVDKCQHKATPVDKDYNNYLILKDAFDFKPAIFNSICESLIKSSGERI